MENGAATPRRSAPRRALLRWLRVSASLVAAIVALAVVSFFAVPPLAKRLLVERLGESLHRPVSVREVRFNPLKLIVTITGFTAGEPGGRGEFFGFDELTADIEAVSLLHRAPVLREVRLSGPRVHVARGLDGRTYNFSDLVGGEGRGGGAKAAKGGKPALFALHNIRISRGRIEFEDRPRGTRHEVADLEVTVPFVSNFPARIDTFEQPSLSALVNGAPFRLAGETKPFKETLETVVDVDLHGVDVPRYLSYLPADLGFTVNEGTLGVKLSVSFSVPPEGRSLVVRGSARLDKLAVTERTGAPLLALAALDLPAFSVDVFKRRVDVERIVLTAPDATVVLRKTGSLNWTTASWLPGPRAREPEPTPWQVTLGEARLSGGSVHWRDEAVPGGFSAELEEVAVEVRALSFPQRDPAQIELGFRTGFGEAFGHRGSIQLSPFAWEGDVQVAGVRPRAWEPYYRRAVEQEIREGVFGGAARVRLAAGESGTAFSLSGLTAHLEGLKVRHRGAAADFLTLAALDIAGADLDLPTRHLSLGAVAVRKASLGLVREASGRVAPGVPKPVEGGGAAASLPEPIVLAAASAAVKPAAPGESPWLIEAASVRFDDCGATLVDTAFPDWLSHTIAPLDAEVTDFSTKKGSRAAFRITAGINGGGRLVARGDVGLVPFRARVDIDLKALALVPWYPYYAERVNFVTSNGELAVKGALVGAADREGRTAASFRGEARLTDFVSVDRLNSEEMVRISSLALSGIALESSPFSLGIDEALLSEFYLRLIIFADGRLNVQKAVSAEGTEVPPSDAPPPGPPAEETRPAAPPAAEEERAAVAVARLTLQGGTVNFSDRFIRPNYSANLTDLAGSVAGLSSKPGTTADLAVRGRLNHLAPLTISGKINPLAGDLFLDVKTAVRDIELGPFSPYSGKYLGYGIEKGKMSFDVAYRIENRQLSAENRLVLDQLTFGEKVESPEATSLPVRLAVALLKDRNGVIDVNLPIGGSLDDPKFSVGRIILQIILNIIVKVVTSPFALIGSLFGGGEELSFAPFEPGGEAPLPEGLKRIEALRAALVERPGLDLEIAGAADPASDRESLRQRRFEQLLKAEKLKDTARKGLAAPSLDAVEIEAAEYEKYLRRAYKAASFPRPRNFLGMLKELPVQETENLLLTNTLVTDDDLVDLANRRAQAAKAILTAEGAVAPERVYLLAPVAAPADPKEERPPARVDFTLKEGRR